MKFLAKIVLVAGVAGVGTATMYAAPGARLNVGVNSPEFADQMIRAGTIHDSAVSDLRHGEYLAQMARKQKDVIKLNCVNDKLIQMKAELNILDHGRTELEGGGKGGFHEVTAAGDEMRQLREGADQCMGATSLGNESSNTYTHPDIPDSPTNNPYGGQFEPPAYASPFN